MLRLFPTSCSRDNNLRLALSLHLPLDQAAYWQLIQSLIFKSICVFAQQINIINTDQKLTYPIQIQSPIIFLDLPDKMFYSGVKKQWW